MLAHGGTGKRENERHADVECQRGGAEGGHRCPPPSDGKRNVCVVSLCEARSRALGGGAHRSAAKQGKRGPSLSHTHTHTTRDLSPPAYQYQVARTRRGEDDDDAGPQPRRQARPALRSRSPKRGEGTVKRSWPFSPPVRCTKLLLHICSFLDSFFRTCLRSPCPCSSSSPPSS